MTVYFEVLLSGVLVGGMYALIGLGLTLVFGVSRIINFAHGDFVVVGMYAAIVVAGTGLDPYLTIPLVVVLMTAFGWVIARGIIVHTMKHASVVQIFVTIGLALVIQNGLLLIFGSQFRTVRTGLDRTVFSIGAFRIPATLLVAFLVAMTLTFGVLAYLKYTDFGRAIRATAQERRSASLMGINTRKIDTATFCIGTALTGVAGVLLLPVLPASPTAGISINLIAFVVVVLGGLGSIPGVLAGGLIIGIVESFSGYILGSGLRQIVYFVVFVLVIILRPSGLFGARGGQEVGFR